MDNLEPLFSFVKVNLKESSFFKRIFTFVARRRKENRNQGELSKIIAEEFDDLSRRADRSQIQEAIAIRSTIRSRKLAKLLINSKGALNFDMLSKAISLLKKHQSFIDQDRMHDTLRQRHMLKMLEALHNSSELQKVIKNISKPHANIVAERLIRETLDLADNEVITDSHTRTAALSSLIAYLRQSVGSCFATAPALIIQREQPVQFLNDINTLLSTGRLKRVVDGIEYTAPLSVSWGVGDLRKPIIIESDNSQMISNIGFSPGLLAALEAAGVIDKAKGLSERVDEARNYISKALPSLKTSRPFISTTAEDVLKIILMDHFEITQQDLVDYSERPRDVVFKNLLTLASSSSKGPKGGTESIHRYFAAFNSGKSAFKRLAENALLKSWEFSIASFSETKSQFATWNLYTSLGFDPQEENGIGQIFYKVIKEKLDASNQKVHDFQYEYETLYSQLKYVEGRVRSASTEKELQWLRAEYQSKLGEFQTFEILRNKEHYRAQRLASLFNDLIDHYIALFPRYFQEVYDAEMHDVVTTIYDDRPAGFRLLYKHGRSNTSQWTRIESPSDFQEALASFFVITESEISHDKNYEAMGEDLSQIVTEAVGFVKTKEFLEASLNRMVKSHSGRAIKDPLEHLDQIDKKPWAYTSGGSLHTLISCYFKLNRKPKEQERWVESPFELLVFLLDSLKHIPYKLTEPFLKSPDKSFLIHSPTHAFTLKPGFQPFSYAWQSEQFTYTWVRDNLVNPVVNFYELQVIDEEKYRYLIAKFAEEVPVNYRPRIKQIFSIYPGERNPRELREYMLDRIEIEHGIDLSYFASAPADTIDTLLFGSIPLIYAHEFAYKAEILIKKLSEDLFDQTLFDQLSEKIVKGEIYSTEDLISFAASYLTIYFEKTSFEENYLEKLIAIAREQGFLPPAPILFADTNWQLDYFAFLVNPGNSELELWRTNYLGTSGAPMSIWKKFLDGSVKKPTWGLFTNPIEYKL